MRMEEYSEYHENAKAQFSKQPKVGSLSALKFNSHELFEFFEIFKDSMVSIRVPDGTVLAAVLRKDGIPEDEKDNPVKNYKSFDNEHIEYFRRIPRVKKLATSLMLGHSPRQEV